MNSLTFPILRLLADGQFHSGEDIARQFSVSRATVWNAIQQVEALGLQVFSIRGKGYRLPEPMQLLEREKIESYLQGTGVTLQLFEQIDSTNSRLMKLAAEGAAHGVCLATEIQTDGRGRRGRNWFSHPGGGLAFSLLWRFDCGASGLSGLSLAVGIGLMRALQELGAKGVALKWPNDVLHDHKKLAGILIELQGDVDGPSAAVIGVGLNLNIPDVMKQSIGQPVTDLARALPKLPDRNLILGFLLRHMAVVLREFSQHGFAQLQPEWTSHHAYQQQEVRMLMPDGSEVRGKAAGVANDGALLLDIGSEVQRFLSGEVSLRAA